MVNAYDLSPALRGKSADEQSRVAQAIMAACREGRFPLSAADTRALSEFVIDGIRTTLPLHARLLDNEQFLAGAYDVHWLEHFVEHPG